MAYTCTSYAINCIHKLVLEASGWREMGGYAYERVGGRYNTTHIYVHGIHLHIIGYSINPFQLRKASVRGKSGGSVYDAYERVSADLRHSE
jgi:hypothetical protein